MIAAHSFLLKVVGAGFHVLVIFSRSLNNLVEVNTEVEDCADSINIKVAQNYE